MDEYDIDMLSSSGHKINGPKGIGFLYIRKGVKIRSFVHGGAQERKRRAGTENVPGIVGYGVAARRAAETMRERTQKEIQLRDYMIQRINAEVPNCKLNGHPSRRLPNNVNFSFEFVEGESLLIMLDMEGICASSGSACTSGSLSPDLRRRCGRMPAIHHLPQREDYENYQRVANNWLFLETVKETD